MANPIQDLAAYFDSLHRHHVGTRYLFAAGKDAKILKDLRAVYTDEQIRGFMDTFFALEDEWLQQVGYSIGILRAQLPKILVAQRAQAKPTKTVQGIAAWLKGA